MLSDDDRDDIRLIVREELRARMRTLYVNVAFAIIAALGVWALLWLATSGHG